MRKLLSWTPQKICGARTRDNLYLFTKNHTNFVTGESCLRYTKHGILGLEALQSNHDKGIIPIKGLPYNFINRNPPKHFAVLPGGFCLQQKNEVYQVVDVRTRHSKGCRCRRAAAEKSPWRIQGEIWLPLPPSAGRGMPDSFPTNAIVWGGVNNPEDTGSHKGWGCVDIGRGLYKPEKYQLSDERNDRKSRYTLDFTACTRGDFLTSSLPYLNRLFPPTQPPAC